MYWHLVSLSLRSRCLSLLFSWSSFSIFLYSTTSSPCLVLVGFQLGNKSPEIFNNHEDDDQDDDAATNHNDCNLNTNVSLSNWKYYLGISYLLCVYTCNNSRSIKEKRSEMYISSNLHVLKYLPVNCSIAQKLK